MKYQLLVVDDEASFRTTLCSCFPWDQIGFEIAGQAGNGQMALDFLKKHTVHVLLCDIRMPFMDGLELAKILSSCKDAPYYRLYQRLPRLRICAPGHEHGRPLLYSQTGKV